MEKSLFQNVPLVARSKYLADNADKPEKKSYMRQFTSDEMDQRKQDLADACITLDKLESDKKDFMDTWKESAKPYIEQKKLAVTELKQGAEFVDDICYKFVDHEEGMVGWYTPEGFLIEQRKIRPEESQGNMFTMRTGTE